MSGLDPGRKGGIEDKMGGWNGEPPQNERGERVQNLESTPQNTLKTPQQRKRERGAGRQGQGNPTPPRLQNARPIKKKEKGKRKKEKREKGKKRKREKRKKKKGTTVHGCHKTRKRDTK